MSGQNKKPFDKQSKVPTKKLELSVQSVYSKSIISSVALEDKNNDNIFVNVKFPKPRTVINNEYPDLIISDPLLLQTIIYSSNPPIDSDHDKYIQRTIDYLKSERNKQQVSINYVLGNKLCFIPLIFEQSPHPIQALIDTGATTSLMTLETAETLGLKVKPMSINLNTATGSSKTAIKGIAHAKFGLKDVKNKIHTFCTIFVISTNLNNMQAILGAEFLLDPTRVTSITGKEIVIDKGNESSKILLTKLSPTESIKVNTTLTDITACTCDVEYKSVNIQQAEMYVFKTNHEIEMEETLPQANQLFDENFDLDHEVLDKKFK
jgi:predicted aspartyl protease